MTIGLIRGLFLIIPLLLVLGKWHRATPAERSASLVSFFWLLGMLFTFHLFTAHWWAYQTDKATLYGLPVDLWWGWALAWGPVPVLYLKKWPVWLVACVMLWCEALVMTRTGALIALSPSWLVGELLGIVLLLVPAQLLARWTLERTRLAGRVVLQMTGFATLSFVVLPLAATEGMGQAIDWQNPTFPWMLPLILVCLVPPLLAVRQLYEAGGTPFPWDPPDRLVTTGWYARVRNPMQLFMCLGYVLATIAWSSPALLLIPVAAIFFSLGIGDWHEQDTMHRKFGAPYLAYRASVRAWLPLKKRNTD